MRIFGSDRMDGMLQKLGLKEDEAIVHPWINKALEKAQQKVEARNFDIRKNLLKYDDVMNDQRKVDLRAAPRADGRRGRSTRPSPTCATTVIDDLVAKHIPRERLSRAVGRRGPRRERCASVLDLDLPVEDWAKEEGIADEEMRERIEQARRRARWRRKVAKWGPDVMRYVEKSVLLQTLDHLWREHLVHARPSAPGDRPARLRPARSAERIQGGGLRAVRGDDRAPARGGHRRS